MGKRAILHILHTEMLSLKPIEAWMRTFADEQFSRTSPTEIVLPAVGLGGPAFYSEVQPYPRYLEPQKSADTGKYVRPFHLFPDWVTQCREIDDSLRVWACINPVYAFLDLESVRAADQHDMRLQDNACITNAVIQEITDTFLREILPTGVDGIVFDLTDIYPQSGSNVLVNLQNTCFCSYCLEALAEEGFEDGPELFVGQTNPMRLVLRVDDDGTANFPVNLDWAPEFLVNMSVERGFVKDGDSEALNDARILLHYLRCRSRAVAKSVRRLGKVAREAEKRVAVILNDKLDDLSTMTDVATLQRQEAVDEFWVPEINRTFALSQQIQACAYLYARATYTLNAFFETFEDANQTLSLSGVESFLSQVQDRSRYILGNWLRPANVFAVDKAPEYHGFVGIPLSKDRDFGDLVNLMSRRATKDILPPEILDAVVKQITGPTVGNS